jgi:hypothetical protein
VRSNSSRNAIAREKQKGGNEVVKRIETERFDQHFPSIQRNRRRFNFSNSHSPYHIV